MTEIPKLTNLFKVNVEKTKKRLECILKENISYEGKYTQCKIAETLSLSKSTINDLLNPNNTHLAYERIIQIADLLGISYTDILVYDYDLLNSSSKLEELVRECFEKEEGGNTEIIENLWQYNFVEHKNLLQYYDEFDVYALFLINYSTLQSNLIPRLFLQDPCHHDDIYIHDTILFNINKYCRGSQFDYLSKVLTCQTNKVPFLENELYNDKNQEYIDKINQLKNYIIDVYKHDDVINEEKDIRNFQELFKVNKKVTQKNLIMILEIILENEKVKVISKFICKMFQIDSEKLINQCLSPNNKKNLSYDMLLSIMKLFHLPQDQVIVFNYQLKEYRSTLTEFCKYIENYQNGQSSLRPTQLQLMQYNNIIKRKRKYTIAEIMGGFSLLSSIDDFDYIFSQLKVDINSLDCYQFVNTIIDTARESIYEKACNFFFGKMILRRSLLYYEDKSTEKDIPKFKNLDFIQEGIDEYYTRGGDLQIYAKNFISGLISKILEKDTTVYKDRFAYFEMLKEKYIL